ncbi:hypothetical protein VTN00DRAFT_5862 [Thermoascus crustaceus]|uniref:uncharacterized protein n=1 Tax=Thermoascus crustaceus TaxID=5088 RepID=UPI0037433FA2
MPAIKLNSRCMPSTSDRDHWRESQQRPFNRLHVPTLRPAVASDESLALNEPGSSHGKLQWIVNCTGTSASSTSQRLSRGTRREPARQAPGGVPSRRNATQSIKLCDADDVGCKEAVYYHYRSCFPRRKSTAQTLDIIAIAHGKSHADTGGSRTLDRGRNLVTVTQPCIPCQRLVRCKSVFIPSSQ